MTILTACSQNAYGEAASTEDENSKATTAAQLDATVLRDEGTDKESGGKRRGINRYAGRDSLLHVAVKMKFGCCSMSVNIPNYISGSTHSQACLACIEEGSRTI